MSRISVNYAGIVRPILIVSTLVGSWLGMQAVHELGHIIGAWATGGRVTRVVVYPLSLSRTDVLPNPEPQIVVWAGPVWGVLLPLAAWGLAAAVKMPGTFVLRFFAGVCLVANGLYIGLGSFGGVGDCGVMLRHGSQPWQLWLFGFVTAPLGIWLWQRQGKYFGLGPDAEPIQPRVFYGSFIVCLALILFGFYNGR